MIIQSLLKFLPLRCSLCQLQLSIKDKQALATWCQVCAETIRRKPRCLHCGLPTPKDLARCGRCLTKPPAWQNLYCVDAYEFPLDKLLHRFKYQRQFWLAQNMTSLLCKEINQPAPVLIPVPMHWKRQLLRGYNQSHVLASQLAKKLNVQCESKALIRSRFTKRQQGLSKKERLFNLKDAFELVKPLPKHIALVDDVVTTGSTINEICRLLKKNHVEKIEVYCVARSFIDKSPA